MDQNETRIVKTLTTWGWDRKEVTNAIESMKAKGEEISLQAVWRQIHP